MFENSITEEVNIKLEKTIVEEISNELENDALNENIKNSSIERESVSAPAPTELPWKIAGRTITTTNIDLGIQKSMQDIQDKLGSLLQRQNGKKIDDSVSHQLMKKTTPKESHVPFDAKIIILDTNGLKNSNVEHEKVRGLEKTKQRKKRKPRNRKRGGSASSNSPVNEEQHDKEKTKEEVEEKKQSLLNQKIETDGQTKKSKRTSRKTHSLKQKENNITVSVKSDNKDINTSPSKKKTQNERKQNDKNNNKIEHGNGHNNKDTRQDGLENRKLVEDTHVDVHIPPFQIENVAKQLQYYFSDENLVKDEYLKSLFCRVNGFVPLSSISGFYRLSNMSKGGDPTIILGAIYLLLSSVTNGERNFEIATILDLPLNKDNVLSKYIIRSKNWKLYVTTERTPIEYNHIKIIDHRDLTKYKRHSYHY